MEQRREQFYEKVLGDSLTKEQWFEILRNGELVGLRDMKILLNLYSSSGQPLKTAEIGENLDFGDVGNRIQNMGKRIIHHLGVNLEIKNDINSWEYRFRYWLFMFDGKKEFDESKDKYCFVWNLKSELKEAINLMFNA